MYAVLGLLLAWVGWGLGGVPDQEHWLRGNLPFLESGMTQNLSGVFIIIGFVSVVYGLYELLFGDK